MAVPKKKRSKKYYNNKLFLKTKSLVNIKPINLQEGKTINNSLLVLPELLNEFTSAPTVLL